MTTTAQDLRASLIGAWTLESYESRSLDGSTVIYPLGPDAQGTIMYTPDGYMSAQLMRSGRAPFHHDDPHLAQDQGLTAAASGYLAYSGPYTTVNDNLIAHHVMVSLMPNWIGRTQYRMARLQGSRLELSPAEPTLVHGELRNAKLIWRRANPNPATLDINAPGAREAVAAWSDQ